MNVAQQPEPKQELTPDGTYPYLEEYAGWEAFLRSFEWDLWVTLTFKQDLSHLSMHHAVENFQKWLTAFRVWHHRHPAYLLVVEDHRVRPVPHVHALVGNTGGFSPFRAEALWEVRFGRALVAQYDPSKGAARYLAAKLAKGAYSSLDRLNGIRRCEGAAKLRSSR